MALVCRQPHVSSFHPCWWTDWPDSEGNIDEWDVDGHGHEVGDGHEVGAGVGVGVEGGDGDEDGDGDGHHHPCRCNAPPPLADPRALCWTYRQALRQQTVRHR